MPLTALVDLVNEWGDTPRAAAGEDEAPYPDPARLIGHLGPDESAVTPTDASLTALANRLHSVFSAGEAHACAARVSEMLSDAGVRPVVSEAGGSSTLGWLVERSEDVLLASAAITLLQQLTTRAPDRLGTCAGRRCADVYVDLSPQGVRRYCSVACQNRARVAAFRRRRARSA